MKTDSMDKEANLMKILDLIDEAVKTQADLIVANLGKDNL